MESYFLVESTTGLHHLENGGESPCGFEYNTAETKEKTRTEVVRLARDDEVCKKCLYYGGLTLTQSGKVFVP